MAHRSTLNAGRKVLTCFMLIRIMLIRIIVHRTPCGWGCVAISTGLYRFGKSKRAAPKLRKRSFHEPSTIEFIFRGATCN
jgi:hypothetical protein